jgi:hypothetical protein
VLGEQTKKTTKSQNQEKIMKSSKLSKLPIQAAPVERTITGAPVSSENGVEASGWWDIIKGVGSGIGKVGDLLF